MGLAKASVNGGRKNEHRDIGEPFTDLLDPSRDFSNPFWESPNPFSKLRDRFWNLSDTLSVFTNPISGLGTPV